MTQGGDWSTANGRNGDGDRRSSQAHIGASGVDALLDVQRRGLHAAGELVDRLIRAVDGAPTADEATAGRAPADHPPAGDRDGDGEGGARTSGPATDPVSGLVDLWADVARRGLGMVEQMGGGAPDAAPPDGSQAAVTLEPVAPERVVRVQATSGAGPPQPGGEIWLHNRGARARHAVALRSAPLITSDGSVVAADDVTFSPAVVDLPARSSRGVTVAARTDAAPGTYRGIVVASGAPDAWLVLEVRVGPGPAEAHDDGDGR